MPSLLEEYLDYVPEPNRSRCLRLWSDNHDLFERAQGSKTKHHAWPGGYLDHITDMCMMAKVDYDAMAICGSRYPFEFGDVVLGIYLHDLEKPWKQGFKELGLQDARGQKDEERILQFKFNKIREYGIELSPEVENAVRYAEGEKDDYDPFVCIQGPLAAFVAAIDLKSARIFHNRRLNERRKA